MRLSITLKSLVLATIMLAVGMPSLAQNANAAAGAATLTIGTKGEEMAFDKTTLTVKAGQKVKLTFKNLSSMQHNWVLVKPGTADTVANASISAGGEKGWLAIGPDVIAHTKMVDAKSEDTITFSAPKAPGEYPFICTFPGHASIMRGLLVVK